MKSKASKEVNQKSKKRLERRGLQDDKSPNKLTLFDHVKHIRGVQDPNYYNNLSEENRKSFNHFMILRALSMDSYIVEEMAFLYRYFDKIPPPQFYTLLINLVPRQNRWVPWVKAKVVKHSNELLTVVANHFKVSKRQANEYVNILINTEEGLNQLVDLCQGEGVSDTEIEKMFDKKKAE